MLYHQDQLFLLNLGWILKTEIDKALAYGVYTIVMGDLKFAGLIVNTEQLTWSITFSAVLPISRPDNPDRPIVPMTIRSIPFLSA